MKLNKALFSVVPAQSKDSVSDSKAAKISIFVFNLKREYSSRLAFFIWIRSRKQASFSRTTRRTSALNNENIFKYE